MSNIIKLNFKRKHSNDFDFVNKVTELAKALASRNNKLTSINSFKHFLSDR